MLLSLCEENQKTEKEAFRMNKDHLPCGELMKRIHEAMDAHANSQMQKTGITFTQFKWLVALYETGGGTASLKELERSFRVAQSTAAGIVSRLEKKHFLESFTDPQDKRIKHVRITEEGCAVCESTYETMVESERRMLAGLTAEEQEQFRRYLQRVYDNIK